MDVLRGAEFYTPDGDGADFKVVTGRVCDLVDALRPLAWPLAWQKRSDSSHAACRSCQRSNNARKRASSK